jgi:uncharacterized protein (DUF1499 family)
MIFNKAKLAIILTFLSATSSNAFTTHNNNPSACRGRGLHSQLNAHENNNDINSRREYLTKSLATLSLILSTTTILPAKSNAFENKISNQWDDRPKRRGPQPKDLGVLSTRKDMVGEQYTGLKSCGPAPNCFCSTDDAEDDPDHSIPSWSFPKNLSKEEAFKQLEEVLNKYVPGQGNIDGGGFKVVTVDVSKKYYIYAQFEALKNGYIDDFEVAYIPSLSVAGDNNDGNSVQVRSSSRVGYLDFGVNSKRVNHIAKMMRDLGWNAPGVEYGKHKGYYAENQISP